MPHKIIKVLIVDDSPVARDLLKFIINSDPDLSVIGTAESGEKAIEMLSTMEPDVITMDIVMPRMNGFEVTKRIMQKNPIPIVIISGDYTPENMEQSFRAVDAGALAILPKPAGVKDSHFEQKAAEIIETIKAISTIKMGNHLPLKKEKAELKFVETANYNEEQLPQVEAIAIGASLGGPKALSELFSALPKDFSVPIFVVQHISEGFTKGFVDWLQKNCPLEVRIAKNGEQACPGCVYIAPDKQHLEVKPGSIIALTDEPKIGICPSISVLFKSFANVYGPHSIGVMLTGMGRDGADEMLLMRQKGAFTIAQNEQSCVMFGMPKEAIKIGAAQTVLPLELIGPKILRIVSQTR
jgi:two-component system chemotaxis response regulator CheB